MMHVRQQPADRLMLKSLIKYMPIVCRLEYWIWGFCQFFSGAGACHVIRVN